MILALRDDEIRQLHRYTMLEYLLIGDLRDLLEESDGDQPDGRWLLAVLDALLTTLPREFELQERGGYLSEVVDEIPTWSDAVDKLRRQHEVLCVRLQQLRDRVAWQVPLGLVAHLVKLELRDWINAISAHRRHERRLVQTASSMIFGTCD